jgi:hypothetical protein
MREKCRFLFEHVEITAILAVFCGLSGRIEQRDILFSLRAEFESA